ncbi:MAG: hypothetical protein K6T66_14535 [Peptococcaceae bacterium]|nr:hypothetical protein [Peptococcaceae bacterium]
MKNALIIAFICVLAAGCGPGGGPGAGGLEKEVFPVVEKHLENAAAGNWPEVYETLSGEALAETKANSGRVEKKEKIVRKSLKAAPVCRDVAEVSADFTVNSGGEFDRLAYTFRLKKSGGRWLIYKTAYGHYHRGELRPVELPPGAAGVIKEYFELPLSEKRRNDQKYLAGKLLRESGKAKLLPVDSNTLKEQEKIVTRVESLECLGLTEGYAVALVNYQSVVEGKIRHMEALVDLIDVNGNWKICGLDITKSG